MLIFIYILAIVLCDASAQSVIQYCQIHKTYRYLFMCLVFYAIAAFFLFLCYNERKIGIVNSLVGSIGIVVCLIIGSVFFKEKITCNEYIGILFILMGICVIESKKITWKALTEHFNFL